MGPDGEVSLTYEEHTIGAHLDVIREALADDGARCRLRLRPSNAAKACGRTRIGNVWPARRSHPDGEGAGHEQPSSSFAGCVWEPPLPAGSFLELPLARSEAKPLARHGGLDGV
jgi:hypothetical protein